MTGSDGSASAPQFDTVEYTGTSGNCVLCNQPIGSTYYRVNGAQACAICAEKEKYSERDANANYTSALIFGIGAAIVGMVGYAVFEIVTGWIIGYVSVGVGWLVAKAMLKGSKGAGGRRYQITAALLTYMAVSLAAIPVMVSQVVKQKKENQRVYVQQPAPATSQGTATAPSSSNSNTQSNAQAEPDAAPTITVTDDARDDKPIAVEPQKPKEKMGFGKAIGLLFLVGLASPFLELASPLSGIIGLFILFIGMQIAWKMTARPSMIIDGPF